MIVTVPSSKVPIRSKASRKLRVPRLTQIIDHAEAEAEVADAVDDERLLSGARGRRLLVPEADEGVAAQADRLPADVEHQEVVAQDQQQHAEHEQVQVGEEAPVPAVAVHVADGVDVDEEADRADDQQKHRGQAVDQEADVDLEVARRDPSVDGDLVLVAADDDVDEDDHADRPHQADQQRRDDPGPISRPLRARRDVPGLPDPVVEVGGDDAGGTLGVGEVVGMAGVRAGGRLLLLRRHRAEPRVVDVMRVVRFGRDRRHGRRHGRRGRGPARGRASGRRGRRTGTRPAAAPE